MNRRRTYDVEGPREQNKGFAQMPKEEVSRIGRKGGKHSHGSRGKLSEEEYQQELEDYSDEAGFGEGEEIENYGGSYKTGFASMPKSKVSKIGKKGGKIGGKHSHGFGPQYYSEDYLYPHPGYKERGGEVDNEEDDETYTYGSDVEPTHIRRHHGNQGFASMPKKKVREIASKGGQVSGKRRHEESEEEEEETPRRKYHHHGKQGFASMSKQRVREIASMGGKESGRRRHEAASESEEEEESPEEYETTSRRQGHHGKQGFASMSKEKVREIASKGGQESGRRRHEAAMESEEEEEIPRRKYHHHGKQGFASMSKQRVREIASMGGKESGRRRHEAASESEEEEEEVSPSRKTSHHGKQGFASMSKQRVREIASMGGKESGRRRHEASESENEEESSSRKKSHHGKQGFASMPKEKVRKIAAMGGHASHSRDYDQD